MFTKKNVQQKKTNIFVQREHTKETYQLPYMQKNGVLMMNTRSASLSSMNPVTHRFWEPGQPGQKLDNVVLTVAKDIWSEKEDVFILLVKALQSN